MNSWLKQLKHDPLPTLLNSPGKALVYFTRRDLLDEKVEPISFIWNLPEAQKILKKQQADGSWGKAAKNPAVYPPNHNALVETFKSFRLLVERYGFTKDHPAIPKAAEFLFTFQTKEGDIRGFIGNQYATYYTGYVLALLVQAGYAEDNRIEKAFQWLLSMRQNDGAWTIPLLTHKYDRDGWLKLTSTLLPPLEPDKTKPFSHNWTDMVLRAFAAHLHHRNAKEAKAAGSLLKTSFFQRDFYPSLPDAKYWTRFIHWWPNLLTALESLAALGFSKDDPDIQKGLQWFIDNQQKDALWKLDAKKPAAPKDLPERLWLALRVCRMLKNFYG